jgi:hypothetical protein
MANNKIPVSYDPIVTLLHNAVAGARDHGDEVGLKQNDEATLRPLLDALAGTESQLGAKGAWNTAKSRKVAATAALREVESRGRALVMAIVGVLKLRLGSQWNAQWHEAGFSQGTLHIPDHPHAILLQLRSLLLAHPDYEVPNLSDRFACTVAACQVAAEAIDAAKTASQASNAEASAAKQHLEQAIANAKTRLTGLRHELALLLGPDDARWYAFGFDRPNDSQIPAIPAHVTATVGTAGNDSLFVEWDDARRADSYRAVLFDVATGQSVAEKLVYDSEAVFTGLPAGTHLKIAITSRNDAGESQPSEAVTVQLS